MYNFVPVKEELEVRRAELLRLLPDQAVFILVSNGIQLRNSDVEHTFRQNSSFWYLSGIDEPNCVLLVLKTFYKYESVLFVPEIDQTKQAWVCASISFEQAKKTSGVDSVEPLSSLDKILHDYLKPTKNIYFEASLSNNSSLNKQITTLIRANELKHKSTQTFMKKLRVVKSRWEIEQLKKAAQINTLAFNQLQDRLSSQLQTSFNEAQPFFQDIARPSVYEYQLEAELNYIYKQHNLSWSYPPIVASGNNATTLHYTKNNSKISSGDLVLIDAGCELNYYASDITRTISVGTSLNPAQQEIYNLVLKANIEAIALLSKAFNKWSVESDEIEHSLDLAEDTQGSLSLQDIHSKVVRILSQGLIDLNILSGSLEEVLQSQSYKKYFMHATSHWLGLDVHDAGDYKNPQGDPTILVPGHVFTIEPGIYIKSDDMNVPPELRGIGVRIEDDVVITENGLEVLTESIGK
ncbi:MAG: aminopeptidase P N-terminal domain-containing protein [Patescibacteria group bacterium]